jgi:hypothetical protein
MKVYEAIRDEVFGPEILSISSAPPTSGSIPRVEENGAAHLVAALSSRAADQSQNLHWQTSITDLMELLGIDSSIANRRLLAHELSYSGDEADSVAMDKWLHCTVMNNLAGKPTQSAW